MKKWSFLIPIVAPLTVLAIAGITWKIIQKPEQRSLLSAISEVKSIEGVLDYRANEREFTIGQTISDAWTECTVNQAIYEKIDNQNILRLRVSLKTHFDTQDFDTLMGSRYLSAIDSAGNVSVLSPTNIPGEWQARVSDNQNYTILYSPQYYSTSGTEPARIVLR